MDYKARLKEISSQFRKSAHPNLRYKMSRVRTIVATNRVIHIRPVVAESLIEANLYMWCELIRHVMAIEVQPFTIMLVIDGKQRRYTPDALILTRTSAYIVECKPSREYFDPEFQKLVAAAMAYFAEFELQFVVIDETDVAGWDLQANLSQLWRAWRAPQLETPALSVSAHVRRALEQGCRAHATIGGCLDLGHSEFAVHRALASGFISANLHAPLTREAMLWSQPLQGAYAVLSKLHEMQQQTRQSHSLRMAPAIDWGLVPAFWSASGQRDTASARADLDDQEIAS
ncbi:MAG: Tn7 transposase TnsA N-terminal domain-containing protein [Burkholderiaceae bacterium]